MKLKPILNSLLETDQYKMNMSDVIFRKFNDYTTIWSFKCRNADVKFTPEMIQEIREQVDWYCNLRFAEDELDYLRKSLPWLSVGFINHLKFWHPVRSEIFINEGNIQPMTDCGLAIEAKGTWLNTTFYEIAILSIVSEVYYAFKYGVGAKDIEFQKRTIEKFGKIPKKDELDLIKKECFAYDYDERINQKEYYNTHPYDIGTFAEFGMRRRYSSAMQDWLIKYCVEQKVPGFVGTSNLYLAKKYGCRGIGTLAHELIQCIGQATAGHDPTYSNKYTMKAWTDCFGIKNGTYLTDCIKTDTFLLDFDERYATLFSGLRHDSGDPIEWGEKIIAHYKKLGIDPMTKTLLFSDSLNFEKATKIKTHFEGRCKISFGIGTYLAGIQGTDESGNEIKPLNIVMKVTECNGLPVSKISDTHGKQMCRDTEYVEYLKRCIDWRLRYGK